jgi:hypothetical protein
MSDLQRIWVSNMLLAAQKPLLTLVLPSLMRYSNVS